MGIVAGARSMPVPMAFAVSVARAISMSLSLAMAVAEIMTVVGFGKGAVTVTRPRVLPMAVGVTGAVTVAARVGPALRFKGRQNRFHRQPPLAQQVGQHRILQDPQLARVQFHRHMAVAEVIGRLQQGQGVGAAHQQKRFRRRFHPHQPIS